MPLQVPLAALGDSTREHEAIADRTVIERARSNPALQGMGTTLTMAYSVATDLYIVHAGDSRAYLFRAGELEKLTNDHTFVQTLIDGGAMSPQDARQHKNHEQ